MEDNRLIAEFISMPTTDDGDYIYIDPWGNETICDEENFTLAFDSSWDWLMPVVVKMCELKHHEDRDGELVEFQASWSGYPHVTIREKSSNAIYNSYTHYNQFGISHWDVPLHDQIYSGVVEFIKWYNKNKKA